VYIKGQLEKVIPSFYDDLICLPVIVAKIEAIQKTLVKKWSFDHSKTFNLSWEKKSAK
jgi:hypothetical protein